MSTTHRRLTGVALATALLLTACGSGSETPPRPTETVAPAAAAGPTAADVVAAFAAAGLPVRDPRENSCDSLPGCVELVTTDDVSVYRFADAEAARPWAEATGYQAGPLVLSYTAARTPKKTQKKYQQALAELLG